MKSAVLETSTRRMRVYVGDVIESDEDYGLTRLEVMYLGEKGKCMVARIVGETRESPWTLICRDWQLVRRSKLRPKRMAR